MALKESRSPFLSQNHSSAFLILFQTFTAFCNLFLILHCLFQIRYRLVTHLYSATIVFHDSFRLSSAFVLSALLLLTIHFSHTLPWFVIDFFRFNFFFFIVSLSEVECCDEQGFCEIGDEGAWNITFRYFATFIFTIFMMKRKQRKF